ncbi:phosphodiester glycosidase family protein [Streptomyces sp. MAR4 CNX-425]|uniref:phosphodiester glycosidase family protein n=1 Tax=Streptomyces sp. MAR4 CNX-425 TaxID=3406343 RepID=UPI003B50151F
MNSRLLGAGTVLALLATVAAMPSASPAPVPAAKPLPLGDPGLTETRTTETLQPGVTLTRIERGAGTPPLPWTVEVPVPGGTGSPDPDAPPAALRDRASAEELAAELTGDGFAARVEEVTTPAVADFAGGTLGWRVRVGTYDGRAAANAVRARLADAGYRGSATYTGWDGDPGVRGSWRIDVLTVDPRAFRGGLVASYGPDLVSREKTTELAAAAGATAGVNAGFFVLDPRAGAPGDPAGIGVYDGRLLSEPVGTRPALVLHDSARGTRVERLGWRGRVTAPGGALPLDGVDRVPGLIRNCGGTADDTPTAHARHDVTCTDDDEVVAFTEEYGPRTPAGDGVEAVLDAHGRVVALRSPRGGPLPAGGSSVQATGAQAGELAALARPGGKLRIRHGLRDDRGRPVPTPPGTAVVNGGPELVRDGRTHVTPAADGMVRPDDPSFYYGWMHKRNPRTFAGVDAAGRTVLVTADGRATDSLGLSVPESAAVARALGLRDAVNLDGGGSTTMAVGGEVVGDPSDGAGERPVGDALLILPNRR